MKKITTLFVMLVLLLTACTKTNKKVSITLEEGEMKTVSVSFNLNDAVYEVSQNGLVYPSIVSSGFVLKGVKEGNAVVTLYKDDSKKESLTVNVTVTKREEVGEKYTLNFSVSVPEGITDVYLSGTFNGWRANDEEWKLTKSGDKFVLTKEIDAIFEVSRYLTIEYKYIIDGFWEDVSLNRTSGTMVAGDTKTLNDTVTGKSVHPVDDGGEAGPKTYTLTINLTTPVVPDNMDVYLLGNINSWGNGANVSDWKLTKVSNTSYTLTITFETELKVLEYKFSNIGWSHVEKGSSGEELKNRVLTLTEEPMVLNLTVARWA